MKLTVLKERLDGEPRVAATPDTVKRFVGLGLDVVIEAGAGLASGVLDEGYVAAGGRIASSAQEAAQDADIVLKVRAPTRDELALLKRGALLIGLLNPYAEREMIPAYASAGVMAFAMELLPRISRAQSM
ncbi:MAG TPA: NAD(P)(+) transhydrogenase (Re/Si-specific) subunit alpha, partial [Alphaproteobacteria bacterium]|nr:NAD(P)(+) transhydrogenase (Re/Si-specific) subunit alpha [Alphaproteobacteria bacterium]